MSYEQTPEEVKIRSQHLIEPKHVLPMRFYLFLRTWEQAQPGEEVSRETLITLAKTSGKAWDDIQRAFWELESVVNVISRWDSSSKQMMYRYFNMSDEDKEYQKERLDWFDSLPAF